MLGGFFARHPDVAYYDEPRHLWTWQNAYNDDDVLTESDATEEIASHLRSEFGAFVREQGRRRLCEKTPSNCMRLRFVHAVFPDARIIHIIRDGRAVVRSTDEILQQGMPVQRIVQRALQTPVREWPAYASRAVGAVSGKLRKQPMAYWGPRPPGWADWPGNFPPIVIAAKQWVGTVEAARADSASIPSEQLLEIRYEHLMADPATRFAELCEFARVPRDDSTIQHVRETVDPSRQQKWRDAFDDQTLEQIRPVLEPTLTTLGYDW